MTSHLNSHSTTGIKPDMLSGVLTRNRTQHVEHNIRGIAHVHTYRKDDSFMQRRIKKNQIHIKLCPCRNCIQRLHYPTFAAFLYSSFQINTPQNMKQIYKILVARSPSDIHKKTQTILPNSLKVLEEFLRD